MNKKAFTLLELLVVVLIIGILAGIAIPQYQIAVGKAKFSTLKNLTRSIAEARNRYLLTHSVYPQSAKDLDIDIDVNNEKLTINSYFEFDTSEDIHCMIWIFESFHSAAACRKNILGKNIYFYVKKDGYSPSSCLVYSEDENDKANQLCAKETNKKIGSDCKDDGGGKYCDYKY